MHTIALVTQKGGSGKSTLATSLALAARQAGQTVRLIDTDPLGTLSNWQRRRGPAEPLVETVHNAREIEQRLLALKSDGVTLAIIDTPSGVSAASTAAVRYSDLCMIPARPSIADIEASALTLAVVRAWKKPFAFILNQTPIRSQRVGSAAATLSDDAGFDLGDVVAQPFIVMRNDHQDALAAGLSVGEYDAEGKSALEIRNLWTWIETRLGASAAAEVQAPLIKKLPRTKEFTALEFPILLRKQVEIVVSPADRAVPARTATKTSWGAFA
jgi:chromosome partitioning protein